MRSFCWCIFTVFVSLFEGKYQLWGMMLGMNNQILPALHLQQPADGSVLGKPKVVIHNQSIFLLLALHKQKASYQIGLLSMAKPAFKHKAQYTSHLTHSDEQNMHLDISMPNDMLTMSTYTPLLSFIAPSATDLCFHFSAFLIWSLTTMLGRS